MKLKVMLLLGLFAIGLPAVAQDSKENADFKLSLNLYNDGLYDLAAEQLKQFINAFPNTSQGIEARFYLGLTQLKLRKFDDARLTFQTFALTYQDNPKAPDAWWNVGEAYAAVGNVKEAALAYERIKVFHPRSKLAADALVRASKYFALAGERDNARRVLRIVLQEYATSTAVVSARTELGRMYFEDGNIEQAQSELKRVVESDPSPDARAQALLILGNISQAVRKNEQAQANYQEIISKYRSSSAIQGAYVNYGKLLAGSGKLEEAAENFKKALAEKSRTDSSLVGEAMIALADAQTGLGDNAGAATTCDRFLASYPGDERVPIVLWKSAVAAARARNYRASNDACERLLKGKAPETLKRRAAVKRAVNAADQKNLRLAAELYQSFVDQHVDDPAAAEILFRSARIYEQDLRDVRKAASAYELLATRYPRSPLADDAIAGTARCYELLKEFDHALQLYAELIDKYPASESRPEAATRIRMIETFEAKNKDAGLEKLALLVGDVVAEKDRVGLAYRLGEIYFSDLKNYTAAAAQFSNAINSGMTDARFMEALFLRARSYEYLSWKDETRRPQAIESYQTFLRSYPTDPRAESAAMSVFLLSATSLAAAQTAYAQTLALYPGFSKKDSLLLILGGLQEKTDSAGTALETYSAILAGSGKTAAEEASYRVIPLLVRAGSPDSAVSAATRYLASYPGGFHGAEVLARLGGLLSSRGEHERAAECYQRLASEFAYADAAAGARRALADAYLAGGAYPDAIDTYTELLDRAVANPLSDGTPDPSLLLALGKANQLAGNTQEAKKFLFDVLAASPTGPVAGEAYTMLGWIYRTEGSLDVATAYFRQADRAAPGAAATRDVAGMLFETGSYADAITQYSQLVQNAEFDQDRQFFRSRIIVSLLRMDNLAQADKEIETFRKEFPDVEDDLATFSLERGSYYFRKENYANALKIFSEVASKYDESPAAPAAHYWTGKALQATGKIPDAVKQFEQLISQYPQSDMVPRAHLSLGNIYYDAEKWTDAIRNYRVVVDAQKPDPSLLPLAMSNLIETYEIAGLNDGALSLTRKYLELFPNNDDSFDKKIKIGILYGKLGYHDQAVLHLQGLLDQAGSDLEGEIRYYIAEANYNKGDYQQAILDFLKVPYLVTKKGKIDWTANSLYMSGQSYEKMGRYDQAITMYQQIIDRNGIDATFKSAAKKEIDRVKNVTKGKK